MIQVSTDKDTNQVSKFRREQNFATQHNTNNSGNITK